MKISRILVLLAASFALLAPSGFAQAQEGNVGRLFWSWARPGQAQQYEAGQKKHNEFHRLKKDPWEWLTWQVISGNRAGEYVSGSFWHQWKDFDSLPVPLAEDEADYYKNVEPYEANWRGEHIVFMPAHSLPPDSNDPTPYVIVWTIHLKPGMAETYMNAIKKIPEAARKAGVEWRYSFWSVADGAATPSFYISFPVKTWAERGVEGSPFEDVLAKAYGRAEAHEIIKALNDCVAESNSKLLAYRPDLSYRPGTK